MTSARTISSLPGALSLICDSVDLAVIISLFINHIDSIEDIIEAALYGQIVHGRPKCSGRSTPIGHIQRPWQGSI